ncbi:MAG: hypothetical protein JJT85_08750 [Chromatiales bacterium]|nr:hypothetical protein [Chromatiales bacterium]
MRPRFLLSFLLIALLGVLAAMWLLSGNVERLVGRVIESTISETTGTPVTVRAVRLLPSEGRVMVLGLRIGNPNGYRETDALAVERIEVQLDPGAQSPALIRVRSVVLDGMTVTFEPYGTRTNLQELLERIRSARGSREPGREPPELVIDDLLAEGGEVLAWLGGDQEQPQRIALPPVRLQGIGGHSGSRQASDVAAQVLTEIFQQGLARGAEAVLRDLVDQAGRVLGEELREDGREAGRRLRELLEDR